MKQELYPPDVRESPPAYYTRGLAQPADVPLSKEATKRATLKANRFSRWFVVLAFVCLALTHSWGLFGYLVGMGLAVNFIARRRFLKLEKEAALRGQASPGQVLEGESEPCH